MAHPAQLTPAGAPDEISAQTLATAEDHGAGHAPSALGLEPYGWVALAMTAFIAILLWKRVPAAIGRALDRKIAEIRQQLDEASQLRSEAEALRAEYVAKAGAAEAEAAAMVDRARQESKDILVQAEKDAEQLIERRTRMAEDKIAAAERAAVDEVRARAATAATAAAEQLIRDRLDADSDRAMIDRTITELGRAG